MQDSYQRHKEVALQVNRAHSAKEYRPVAVAIIRDRQARVLFVRSALNISEWYLPQGGIEKDEEVITALFREMKEELGISVEQVIRVSFLGQEDLDAESGRKDKRGYSKGKRYFFFLMDYIGDEDIVLQEAEVDAFAWAQQSEVEDLISTTRKEKREQIERVLKQTWKSTSEDRMSE